MMANIFSGFGKHLQLLLAITRSLKVASHQATGAVTCPTCFQTIANPLRETAIALRQIGKGLQMFAV